MTRIVLAVLSATLLVTACSETGLVTVTTSAAGSLEPGLVNGEDNVGVETTKPGATSAEEVGTAGVETATPTEPLSEPRVEFDAPAEHQRLFEGLIVYDAQPRLPADTNPLIGCDLLDAERVIEILHLEDLEGTYGTRQQYSGHADCGLYIGPDGAMAASAGGHAEFDFLVVQMAVEPPLGGFTTPISALGSKAAILSEIVYGKTPEELTLVEEYGVRQLISLDEFHQEMGVSNDSCPRYVMAVHDRMEYLSCNTIVFQRFYQDGQSRISILSQDHPEFVARLNYEDVAQLADYLEEVGY